MWSCAPKKVKSMWWTSLRAECTELLYYLPSYIAAPVLNLTLRLSLTLTLLLQTSYGLIVHWTTGEQRVTQIVCARHFVQKLGQIQHTNKSTTNRISGVWALMSTVVPLLSRSVRRIEWHTYITWLHRRRTCMPGGLYNFQGCASFTAVRETGG